VRHAHPNQKPQHSQQIAVVIATKNREAELANRALRAVRGQTRPPDYLVVVDDSDRRHQEANRRIVNGFTAPAGSPMRVHYRPNDRTSGASGAWNAGLDWLHRQVAYADGVMVAILDDDDQWEPDYLAACARAAEERGLDMVAADIVRHEAGRDAGQVQPAPDVLRARDFLVENAGIQGSNLFVRLGTLLAAGLFDEALPSSTDRDLCIRLADLGFVRYGRLDRPLVHHFADRDRPRLSTPGSSPKLDGLDGFYRKYRLRMTEAEREAFASRAKRLFGWQPPRALAPPAARPTPPGVQAVRPVRLVVGMTTASGTGPALAALLQDLTSLRGHPLLAGLEIVLLENGPRVGDAGRDLERVAQSLRQNGVDAVLVPLETQIADAAAGLFGQPFDRGAERVSIALARTMLQTYLYLWARLRAGAVAWILDDDMRLDNLVWRGGARVERAPLDFVGAVARLRDTGLAIAIGTCTEAPPVPFASCVRTQLVDTWHNLELLAALGPDAEFPELLAENMATRARFGDYYYDLSRRETDQLETPFWYVPESGHRCAGEVLMEIVERLPRILAGEEVFRPLVQDASLDPLAHLQPSVHRGGNAFVFDLEALRDFPNAVPSIGGGDTRRSDMVWSLLNSYVAGRTVHKVPLPVRQHRGHEEVQKLDLDKLVRDIHGYAIYSALEALFLERREGRLAGASHAPDDFDLGEAEVVFAIAKFHKFIAERLYAFQLSFHRAAGIARSLERYLDEGGGWWWLGDPRFLGLRDRLAATIRLFREEYDLTRLPAFRDRVLTVEETVVREWLDTLRAEIRARRKTGEAAHRGAAWAQAERARNAAVRVTRAFGTRELRCLGSGAEGVVLTDGKTVFKCFDGRPLEPAQIEFLRSHLGQWRNLRTMHRLTYLRMAGSTAILVYDYEEGTRYRGGQGGALRLLLDECRAAGIVCNNIHPDNLIVTSEGDVKLVDYGADVVPFTQEGWMLMARRVWLSGRYAARADLKDLMRRSLDDPSLPELLGIEAFLAADPGATKEMLLDARMKDVIAELGPRSVLDYGCGKGRLAAELARAGLELAAYDPDPDLAPAWTPPTRNLRYLSAGGLAGLLACGQRFDVVVCSLVLCVIEDDSELLRAIGDLAKLVAPGGRAIVAICNPAFVDRNTLIQRRDPPSDPDSKCITWKTLANGARRRDVHRPLEILLRAFDEVGLRLLATEATPSIDPDTLEPSSDFLILHFGLETEGRAA